jgi:hypothetical protein
MKSVESRRYCTICEYRCSGISDRKGTKSIRYDHASCLSVNPKFSWNLENPNSIASAEKKYLRHLTNWQNWMNS